MLATAADPIARNSIEDVTTTTTWGKGLKDEAIVAAVRKEKKLKQTN